MLDIDTLRVIGLSGGGPYALAAGAAMPDRVHGVGVLGGVAPTQGPDAISSGLMTLAAYAAPVLSADPAAARVRALARHPAGPARSPGTFLDSYAAVQPRGDKELLARPEFRAMFLDDLLNGSRSHFGAVLSDIILFTRHWGFEAADVRGAGALVARRLRPHRPATPTACTWPSGCRTRGSPPSTGSPTWAAWAWRPRCSAS